MCKHTQDVHTQALRHSAVVLPMFARICVCVCVRASTMVEETTHPAVHVHDISVFVLRNLHDSLSLSASFG